MSWPEGEKLGDSLLRRAFDGGLNAPATTAVGRLFDAAAALARRVPVRASYEGEAPMRLEALCEEAAPAACAAAGARCGGSLAQRLGAARVRHA